MEKRKEDKITIKIVNGFKCIGLVLVIIVLLPLIALSLGVMIVFCDSIKQEPKTDEELMIEWREKERKLYEETQL